mmetsp:Transcript_18895/g.38521  ORF Transcript_18895/g.38521 Transcript_18895/m.38521 type:complete len:117 (+) Transcript_18895:96-446(+)
MWWSRFSRLLNFRRQSQQMYMGPPLLPFARALPSPLVEDCLIPSNGLPWREEEFADAPATGVVPALGGVEPAKAKRTAGVTSLTAGSLLLPAEVGDDNDGAECPEVSARRDAFSAT